MSRGGDTRSDHLSPRRAVKAPGVLLDRAQLLADAHLVDGRRTALAEVVAACLAIGLPVLEREGLQAGLDALEGLRGEECPYCDGYGVDPGDSQTPCAHCVGG